MTPCTHSTYTNKTHGNCDGCRKAHSEYVAGKKADNYSRTASETASYLAQGGTGGIPTIPHGQANSREYLGCECPDCIEAARERWRTSNRRHRTIKRLQQAQERRETADDTDTSQTG